MENDKLILLILYCVAFGMGVVSIVLSVMGEPIDVIILAIGVTALGLAGLMKLKE